jgi:hypothetical protein
MKKKSNFLEMLVWAALVSFIVMQPAHSQSANNGQLGADSTWSQSFDMGTAVEAATATGSVENSLGDTGVMGKQTITTAKAIEPALSPKASLEQAHNGNITQGFIYGNNSFPSGSYSYGFDGTGASISPFNTGLPTCSTGSVDLSITDGY